MARPFINIHASGYIGVGASDVGPCSIQTSAKIDFQNKTATQAAIIGSSGRLTFEGTSGKSCILSGVSDPVDTGDVATKDYVDTQIDSAGIHWKPSCRVTDAGVDVPLPATLTIDGVAVTLGQRVLLRNQSTALENGVYVVNGASQLERATDMTTGDNVANFAYYIEEGDTLAGFAYVVTNDYPADVVDTDVLVFGVFSGDPTVPGGATGVLQYNNAGVFGGISTLSTDATDVTLNGGNLNIQDADELRMGDDNDLNIVHNGSHGFLTNTTGNLTITNDNNDGVILIENTNVTGSIIAQLGTTTSATAFSVLDSAFSTLLQVDGSGVINMNGTVNMGTLSTDGTDVTLNGGDLNIQDADELQMGDGSDLTIVHTGTASTITNTTGNLTMTNSGGELIIDNTNATGSTIVRLGTDDANTDFQVQNNSSAAKMTVTGEGLVSITNTTESTSPTTGSLVTAGGVGIAKKLYVGDHVFAYNGGNGDDGLMVELETPGGDAGIVFSRNNGSGNYSRFNIANRPNGTASLRYMESHFDGTSFGTRIYNGSTGFVPCGNKNMDLGGSSLMWNNLYSQGITLEKGTVTQTGLGFTVTLNAPAGVITVYQQSYSAHSKVNFTLNNSFITSSSGIMLTMQTTSSVNGYFCLRTRSSGSCQISLCVADTASLAAQTYCHFFLF